MTSLIITREYFIKHVIKVFSDKTRRVMLNPFHKVATNLFFSILCAMHIMWLFWK